MTQFKVTIGFDDEPFSPAESYGSDSYFFIYNIGRNGVLSYKEKGFNVKMSDFISWDFNKIKKKHKEYFIFPVYAYVHSGVSFSLVEESEWDSCLTGLFFVNKSMWTTKKDAEKLAKQELKIYTQYANGEVYQVGFESITKCECCNQVKSENIAWHSGIYDLKEEMPYLLKEYGITEENSNLLTLKDKWYF